jgi:hypothetical protein
MLVTRRLGPRQRSILATADRPIDVRDADSRFVHTASPQAALQLARAGGYVGVGNRGRVRYMKKIGGRTYRLTAEGSHTTVGATIARLEHTFRLCAAYKLTAGAKSPANQ